MNKDEVNALIDSYKISKSRKLYLERKLADSKDLLRKLKDNMIMDMISISPCISDVPPPQGQKPSQVEKIAVKVADGYSTNAINELCEYIKRIEKEIDSLSTNTECVELWLYSLTEKEKFIFVILEFEKYSIDNAVDKYKKRYGENVSSSTLKRIKKNAYDKIYYIAE